MALYGVTRFTDRTEEERSRMRMTNPATTSWQNMQAKLGELDAPMAAAGAAGPAAVAALAAARHEAGDRALAAAKDDDGDDGDDRSWRVGTQMTGAQRNANYSMAEGQVSWVNVTDCAACHTYAHFSEVRRSVSSRLVVSAPACDRRGAETRARRADKIGARRRARRRSSSSSLVRE